MNIYYLGFKKEAPPNYNWKGDSYSDLFLLGFITEVKTRINSYYEQVKLSKKSPANYIVQEGLLLTKNKKLPDKYTYNLKDLYTMVNESS